MSHDFRWPLSRTPERFSKSSTGLLLSTNPTVSLPSSSTVPAPPRGATPRTGLRLPSTAPRATPLPEYVEQLDPEPPTDHLSFALGVALGRFGPAGSAAEGILDPATADLSHALPHGILFLDTTLDAEDRRDGLGHPAAAPLHAAWAEHGPAIGTKRSPA